jgi:hypothetical protein
MNLRMPLRIDLRSGRLSNVEIVRLRRFRHALACIAPRSPMGVGGQVDQESV